MSKKNILLAITNGLWLIETQFAEQLGHNVSKVLNGEDFWTIKHESNPEFLIIKAGEDAFYSSSLSSSKPGSVAVINITGPIMKEDNCGDPGTKTYESLIKSAANNPNIDGIVLVIDSPGGTVTGTQSLAKVVSSVDKPIVTVAEDLMASAAYWIGSQSDYVFANTNTTRIGSIGTMLSFSDMQPYWEAQGVKFHEIYATQSTQKNKDFAEARKGNYANIINNTLDPLNNEFLNSVKAARGEKLNVEKTLNGQVYVAQDAIKYGLIDGVGTINDAVNKIYELKNGTPSQTSEEKPQSNNNNMKKITLLASHAALLALCGATIEAGKDSADIELNDELINKINSELESKKNLDEKVNLLTDQLSSANSKVGEQQTEIESQKSTITELQNEVKVLGGKSAGTTSSIKAGADKVETSEEDKYLTSVDIEKKQLNS